MYVCCQVQGQDCWLSQVLGWRGGFGISLEQMLDQTWAGVLTHICHRSCVNKPSLFAKSDLQADPSVSAFSVRLRRRAKDTKYLCRQAKDFEPLLIPRDEPIQKSIRFINLYMTIAFLWVHIIQWCSNKTFPFFEVPLKSTGLAFQMQVPTVACINHRRGARLYWIYFCCMRGSLSSMAGLSPTSKGPTCTVCSTAAHFPGCCESVIAHLLYKSQTYFLIIEIADLNHLLLMFINPCLLKKTNWLEILSFRVRFVERVFIAD